MACVGHSPNLSTGTATCTNHRPVNTPGNPALPNPGQGASIKAADITNLRNYIRSEIDRWKQHAQYTNVEANAFFPQLASPILQGSKASFPHPLVDSQDEAMLQVGGPGSPGAATRPNTSANPGAQTIIPYPDFGAPPSPKTVLIDQAHAVGDQITVANYQALLDSYEKLRLDCICNTDCNCNAVCACHGDCGCNYSDMRLKKEIQYC